MINEKLAYKIFKLRDGSPKYCFPLRQFLGEHGLIENHMLVGVKVVRIEDGEEFVIENVYAHWYKGWYYMALIRDKNNSHGQLNWNINSEIEMNNFECYRLVGFDYDFKKAEIK